MNSSVAHLKKPLLWLSTHTSCLGYIDNGHSKHISERVLPHRTIAITIQLHNDSRYDIPTLSKEKLANTVSKTSNSFTNLNDYLEYAFPIRFNGEVKIQNNLIPVLLVRLPETNSLELN